MNDTKELTSSFILREWNKDCKLNPNSIIDEAIRAMNQRSKYLVYLDTVNRHIRKFERQMDELKKVLFLYYEKDGIYSKEELDNMGFDYDPYHGMRKPSIKEHRSYFYNSDKNMNNLKDKISDYKNMKEILDHILKMVHNQSFAFNTILKGMEQ